jgi:hypothetical protein
VTEFTDSQKERIHSVEWKSNIWILPRKWYQGCFDFAFIRSIKKNKMKLILFQITVSKSHNLKLHVLRNMIKALTIQGFEIEGQIQVIAIVPKENFLDFEFKIPIGNLDMIPIEICAGFIS